MTTTDKTVTATTTLPSDREIRMERVFDSPRASVWKALTTPALLVDLEL